VGLLDYYRQWAGMTEEEIGAELRRRSDERRARALQRVEPLDLSGTHWPEFPHPDVVAAITFAARRALNRPADPHARELRAELGRRLGVEPERIVAGHGAAQLLQDAIHALLEPGDELVCPWPSYALYPALARRAGGRAVPVPGGMEPDRLLAALTGRTRAVVVCNPNDPTGEWRPASELARLAAGLPERVWLLVDEALADFVDAEPPNASLALLGDHPRVLVFRTFSKAYALAGLRCGWAVGPSGAAELLSRIEPAGALATPVQAGALEALLECGPLVARRRAAVAAERRRLRDALAPTPYDAAESRANVLWLRLPGVGGSELAERLAERAIRVAPGAAWGDADHVRVQVQSAPVGDRLLAALEGAAA
jgi:histidinol-phosphate aminotransferase